AAVVLAAYRDEGAAPQAPRDLQVPLAPAGIRHDEIFLRQQNIHQALEQDLFLRPRLVPVSQVEGARRPFDVGALLDRSEADMVIGLHRLDTPFEALPASQQ